MTDSIEKKITYRLIALFMVMFTVAFLIINWKGFDKHIKMIISLGLLSGSQLVLLMMLYKKKSFLMVPMLNILTFGLTMSVLSRSYNINGDESIFLLVWLFFVLLFIYLFESPLLLVIYCALSFMLWKNSFSEYSTMEYLLRAGLLVPFLRKYSRNEDGSVKRALIRYYSFVVFIPILIRVSKISIDIGIIFVGFASLFNIYYLSHEANRTLGSIIIYIYAYIMGFKLYSVRVADSLFIFDKIEEMLLIGFLLALSLGIMLKRQTDKRFSKIIMANQLLVEVPAFFTDGHILYNIYFLILSIHSVALGYKENSLKQINIGYILICLWITTKFFNSSIFSLELKLIVGVMILIINIIMNYKFIAMKRVKKIEQ